MSEKKTNHSQRKGQITEPRSSVYYRYHALVIWFTYWCKEGDGVKQRQNYYCCPKERKWENSVNWSMPQSDFNKPKLARMSDEALEKMKQKKWTRNRSQKCLVH